MATDEIASSPAAAEVFAQLQEIEVPPGFANRLELSIRSRARCLTEQNGGTMASERSLSLAGTQHCPKQRVWIAALRIAAVLMVACVGVLTASAHSRPGDALYGLKQVELIINGRPAGMVSQTTPEQLDYG